MPAVTVNASIACGLVAYGIGLHRAIVGEEAHFTVHQSTHVLSTDGAAFYVRLTGPAILAGSVEGLNGTAWRVSYQAWDPGTYLLELILEYSHNAYTGPWKTDFLRGACYCKHCCTVDDIDRMRYEGYHVAGSPFVITVAPAPAAVTAPLPPCNPTRPLDSGRWVLCDGQSGLVSFVEASWCWRAGACTLLPVESFTPESLAACAAGKPKCIVLIGDSIMREQAASMQRLIASVDGTWTMEYMPFFGGVTLASGLNTLGRIRTAVRAVCQRQDCLVAFNSGAHDAYTRMYGRMHFPTQYRKLPTFSISAYVGAMSKARDILETVGASQLVFRTSTAAWLKYGTPYNFNGPRPKDGDLQHQQRFGEGHNVARALNEAAIPLFHRANWSIVDGYAPTLPRPDGQADPLHPGPSLFDPMHAQILALVFNRHCHAKWHAMHKGVARVV